MLGLIGRKVGMTQIANADGRLIPVTVVKAGPVTVTKVLRKKLNGYNAIQVGFEEIKEKHLRKSQLGEFKKNKIAPLKYIREFRIQDESALENFKVGQQLGVDLFQEGGFVDVQGRTIGKGFQGAIKRWSQSRGPETHGSMYHRRGGSVGQSATPSRTFRGHHMPGHMGDETQTVQNVQILKVLKDESSLVLKGSVPGAVNGLLRIEPSLKIMTQAAGQKESAGEKDGGKKAKK